MLIVHCPHCSNGFDLMQAWDDEDARKFTALIVGLPPKAIRPCFKYLTQCFKPPRQTLRWSKLLKLAQELTPMIQNAQIKRNGTFYCVPVEYWVAKMQELVESPPPNLVLPLKSHAYLLTILVNQAEQGASKAEAKAESDKQAGVRQHPKNTESALSFAELTALAAQKQQQREATTSPGTLKANPLSNDVKTSLKEALNLPGTQPTLSPEEKEARKQKTLAQARQLIKPTNR